MLLYYYVLRVQHAPDDSIQFTIQQKSAKEKDGNHVISLMTFPPLICLKQF